MKRILTLAAAALLAVALAGAKPKEKGGRADGAALFSQNCAYCHGAGGRGDGPNAGKLSPKPADLTALRSSEEEIAGVVRNGKGSCPSWKASLSETEIGALARFARSLQQP